MFSVTFNYRESQYEALIRMVKQKEDRKEYRITIMNGELEVQLYGHHLLKEENGKLDLSTAGIPENIVELKTTIAKAVANDRRMAADVHG
ncbi:hypothetical protein LZZ85_21055 [Terrimonas sp. NA20]|uniref:Uncharacterized protein n=1 Tax=Terrimonas ginsenosidimutans TaxID=2908004 RepID=A0ABS9KWV7_9BACT|nr:hypothetical protein [Terrimonas ginsenosidimutans]MCG2616801.1 hypothetical protein [Terrimonas ginsenosidimutans]